MSSTEMRDEAGNATWALHGIVTTISRLINDVGPTHVIVAGDAKGTSDTRRAMLPEYKATRSKAEPDLRYALDTYPRLLESIGISFLSDETWEGDDVMASVARWGRENNAEVFLVTSDKDAYPLIDDNYCRLINPDGTRVTSKRVETKYGIPHHLYTHMAALCGEKSDNIPGIPKVGPKTAAVLINAFGAALTEAVTDEAKLATVLSAKMAANVAAHSERYLFNLSLIKLREHIDVDEAVAQSALSSIDPAAALAFLTGMGLKTAGAHFVRAVS